MGKVLEWATILIISLAIAGAIFMAFVCGIMGAAYLIMAM